MSRFAYAFLACSVLPRLAQAQDADIENVHVRGSQARGFDSRAHIEDSPREITDAASLVEPLIGVHVRRLGADDGFATMSIRGSASNEIAFYLAGVPLPSAADPTVDLATLPLWPGSQARVFRTFTPAALGPGSLGGTLSIEAPNAAGPARTDIWMAGGSFGSLRMRVGDVSDLGRGVRLATGLSASRSDGDFSYYNIDHNAPNFDPRELIPRTNADVAQASGLVSLVAPLRMGESRSGNVRATVMLQDREQGLPGTIFAPTPFERTRSDRELATVELSMPVRAQTIGAQVWGVRQGSEFRDPFSNGLDPTIENTAIVSMGGNVSYKAHFGNVKVSSKLDARGERYEPGDYIGPTPPTGAARTAFGGGADLEWSVLRNLSLAASARLDAWYDTSNDPTIAASFTARPVANIGGEWQLGAIALAAHAGYTARPANFIERFGAPGGFIPTPTLKPESAFTADIGARARHRFGKLEIEGELDGFAQSAQDLITFEYVGARNLLQAENIGQAVLAGVEAQLIARFFGAEIHASYTGLYTENDSPGITAHTPLPSRPAHDFVLDASYKLGPVRVRYGIDGLVGETLDVAGTLPVPARILHSVGARFDIPHLRGAYVAFDVRNLFDLRTVDYPQAVLGGATVPYPVGDVYFFPLPGRSFLVSLAWQPPHSH